MSVSTISQTAGPAVPPKLEEGVPTVRLQLVIPETLMESIDNWRGNLRPIPTKSEAVRQLLEIALEEEAKSKPKDAKNERRPTS